MTFSRSDWLGLAVVLLLAFALRCWQFQNMAVEHFDEGVYASNLFVGDHLNNEYPDQHLYAPPLLPTLFEWTLILTAGTTQSVIWINIILGTALVGVVYWAACEWHDARTALVAGLLAATSEFAIAFSRSALTDIPLAMFLTVALIAGARALKQDSFIWAAVAMISGALAWWTKYNGWLAPAILVSGTVAWCVWTRPAKTEVFAKLRLVVLIAVGVFVLWLPYLWQLQSIGGYAAVAENHRGYFGGFPGWVTSFVRQIQIQNHYLGRTTLAGLVVGWGILIWRQKIEKNAPDVLQLMFLTAGVVVSFWCIWLVIPIGLLMHWLMQQNATVTDTEVVKAQQEVTPVSFWIHTAWVVSLLIAIPLYRAYPRLQLPLHVGMWIAAAAAMTWVVRNATDGRFRYVFPIIGLFFLLWPLNASPAWERRTGLQEAAAEIQGHLESHLQDIRRSTLPNIDCVLYVYAEPGIYYHLSAEDGGSVSYMTQPAGSLGLVEPGATDKRVPALLITGPHAHQDHPELLESSMPIPGLRLIDEVPYQPSDFVLLDDMSPSQLAGGRNRSIRVWYIEGK